MDIDQPAFDHPHRTGEPATRPPVRPVTRLPLSFVVAGLGLLPPHFTLKDSDPLWALAHVESYAADTRPDALSGASGRVF
jgi:hypothetical protein